MKRGKIILSLIVILIHVMPFYILFTTSFKAPGDLSSKWVAPGYLYLDNFVYAWNEASMGRAFVNNIIIFVCSVVLVVVIGSVAAYPLARFKTKWNRFMYTVFVSVMVVPPLTILVPLYKLYVDIGAMNTYWGITLLHVTFYLPVTIFLYTGFIAPFPGNWTRRR